MSKKRPTESSWDSDEELLSDTSGITAFPKTSELDLMGDDGELDEDALLGMDDTKAVSVSFANDAARPMTTRQHSHYTRAKGAAHLADTGGSAEEEQAFVFEDTDTADLEVELTGGVEEDSSYVTEYTGDYTEGPSYNNVYEEGATDVHQASGGAEEYTHEGYLEPQADGGGGYANQGFGDGGPSGGAGNVQESSVELTYHRPDPQEDQVHLEYGDPSDGQQSDLPTEARDPAYHHSDSDSDDDDSRHNRGKFTTERTGMISLTSASKRQKIPDTLEINDEQVAQIEKFMTDKGGKGSGPSGRGGRPNVHSRLGNKRGQPPQGPRGPPPLGPRGPRMRPPQMRPMMRPPFPGSPPRGPMQGGMMNPPFPPGGPMNPLGILANTILRQRGLFPRGPMGRGDRFPSSLRGPFPGPQGMRGPPLPMGQHSPTGPRPPMRGPHPLVQQVMMRNARPPPMRMGGPPGPPGPPMSPMAQEILMRGPRPLMEPGPPGPRLRLQVPRPEQMRGPGPSPAFMGGQPPMRGVVRMGQGLVTRKHKIHLNPNFQGPQPPAPQGITRTVKIGVPLHQRKAKALVERARQVQQTRQVIQKSQEPPMAAAGVKRKSTGGEEVPPKVIKTQVSEMTEDQKMKKLLEEQKKRREIIQKRKELARQKLATVKRQELSGKPTAAENVSEGQIPTVVKGTRIQSRLGPPPNRNQGARPAGPQPIQVRAPSSAPPFQQVKLQPPGPRGAQRPPQRSPFNNPRPGQQQERFRPPGDPRFRGPAPPGMDQRLQAPASDQRFRGPHPQQVPRPQQGFPPQQRQPGPQGSPRMRPPFQQSSEGLQRMRPPGSQPAPQRPPPQRQGVPVHQRIGPPVSQPQQRFGPPPHSAPALRQGMAPPPTQPVSIHQRVGPPPQAAPLQQRLGLPPPISASLQQRMSVPPPTQAAPVHQRIGPPVRQPAPIQQRLGPPAPRPGFASSQPPPSTIQPMVRYTNPPPQIPRPSVPAPQVPGYPQYPPTSQPPPQAFPPTSQPPQPYVPVSQHYTPPTQHYPPIGQPPPSQPYQAPPPVQSYQPPPAQQYTPPAGQPAVPQQYAPPQAYPPTTPQYTPPSNPYAQPAATSHYTTPAPASVDPYTSTTYQANQSSYQAEAAQPSYSYSDSTYQSRDYQYDYPGDPQPVQTVGSLSSGGGDERHVQHAVGQRIETISGRAQPTSGSQIQSIIRNVPNLPRGGGRTSVHVNRTVLEGGQVPVLAGPQKVLITNVPQIATRETLIKICKHFGRVLGVNLNREQNKAVVQFETGDQAAKCVGKCNQKCLHKTRITVKLLPN